MTENERREYHRRLHDALDRLMAGYLRAHPDKRPSTTTLEELMEWSFLQTCEQIPMPRGHG